MSILLVVDSHNSCASLQNYRNMLVSEEMFALCTPTCTMISYLACQDKNLRDKIHRIFQAKVDLYRRQHNTLIPI